MKQRDLKFYTTFNKFFTRELKEGARKIHNAEDKTTIASPCDGRVLSCGEISTSESTIDCVKGRSYRLDEFMLGVRDDQEKTIPALIKKVVEKGNKLFYMVIYLAPSDYHRFHAPAICSADYRRHIAGYLDPVKPAYVNKHRDVFKNNERVNLFGDWAHGFFFISFVGALNVGSIKLTFEPDLYTNLTNPKEPYLYDKAYSTTKPPSGPLDKYLKPEELNKEKDVKARKAGEPLALREDGVTFVKGETTGWFEMGSTIVLIFEGPQDTQLQISEGQKLVLGQEIVTTVQASQ
jgi:phosphatidylserine decarboxylase